MPGDTGTVRNSGSLGVASRRVVELDGCGEDRKDRVTRLCVDRTRKGIAITSLLWPLQFPDRPSRGTSFTGRILRIGVVVLGEAIRTVAGAVGNGGHGNFLVWDVDSVGRRPSGAVTMRLATPHQPSRGEARRCKVR